MTILLYKEVWRLICFHNIFSEYDILKMGCVKLLLIHTYYIQSKSLQTITLSSFRTTKNHVVGVDLKTHMLLKTTWDILVLHVLY